MSTHSPSVRKLLQPLGPFQEGAPEFTLTWESFKEGAWEALPLMRQHYEEVFDFTDRFPFNPQWNYLYALEREGFFHVLAIRDRGTLIGYIGVVLSPMLHTCDCLRARGDSFYIAPPWRGPIGLSSLFLRAIKECERKMKELGVHRMEWVPKRKSDQHVDSGPVFKRLGYIETEYVFSKLL